ncbi:MAG: hypothetical protein ACRDK9_14015 [Solirubrobacterales bacterium]
MSDLGELIELPNGTRLYYRDDDHAYFRCKPDGGRSTRITGVTTVCKPLDHDPDRLLSWSAKTQLIGVAELVAPVLLDFDGDSGSLNWLTSQEAIWRALEDAELTFEHVRDRAAKKGTAVHREALQALALGRPVPNLEALTADERGLARGVMAFWLDHEPQANQVEQIVYSERLGVAGRFDFRGQIKGREGVGVIDLKTGNFISAAAHAQVGGGYPLLAEESGFGPSEWALILKVSESGAYELIPAQGTPAGFEGAVSTYREAARIDREAGKARRAAREAVAA